MKKRKFLYALLSLIMVVCVSFGLAGCKDEKESTPTPTPTPATYTVTYEAGGGTGEAPQGGTYEAGDTFTVATNTFVNGARPFTGWSDGTRTVAAGEEYTMPKKDIVFTAQWGNVPAAQYTLSFSLGEYSGEGEPPAAITREENTSVPLPEAGVTWENHTFLGWKGENGTTHGAGASYTITKNETLTAQWKDGTPSQFTVIFLANGVTFKEVPVEEGHAVSAPHPAPSPTGDNAGKVFRRWVNVETGEPYEFGTPVTGDLTLEASFWYYVDFDINGGMGTPPEGKGSVTNANFNVTMPDATGFSKPNHSLGGWQDATKTYAVGQSYKFTASTTLKAVWVKSGQGVTYTVSYALASRSDFVSSVTGSLPAPFEAEAGDQITVPSVDWVKSGHHIEYWIVQYNDAQYGWSKDDTFGNLQAGNTFAMPAYDIRLAPVWLSGAPSVSDTITIVFNANGGSGTMATDSVKTGRSYFVPTTCAFTPPAGQTWLGWSLTKSGSLIDTALTASQISANVQGNILTLYAIWSGTGSTNPSQPVDPNAKYAITFEYQLAVGLDASAVVGALPTMADTAAGETVTVPETLALSALHYHISGFRPMQFLIVDGEGTWENIVGAQPLGGSFTMPAALVRIVLVWTANDVTISFNANGGRGEMPSVTRPFNTNISFVGSKAADFENKFTGPDGATFLGWGLAPSVTRYELIDNGFTLSASVVSASDTITFYAIWDTSVTVSPGEQNILDFAGEWSTKNEAGNHAITVIAKAAPGDIVGYAVLDGKTFLTIFSERGTLLASNTDDEYVSDYTFAQDGDAFVLTAYNADGHYEVAYTFTKDGSVTASPLGDFYGKWTRSATQKLVVDESGTYYTVQGEIVRAPYLIVGKYFTFSYTGSNGYDYYYILTKGTNALGGYFLSPDVTQAQATFSAGTFYTLKIEGVLAQFINAGSAPAAIAVPKAPIGKKFAHWVLAGTTTVFDPRQALTGDVSITAVFEDDAEAGAHLLTFEGTYGGGTATIVKIMINTQTNEITVTTKNFKDVLTECAPVTATFANGVWLLTTGQTPLGENMWLTVSGDGTQLKIYDAAQMGASDLKATFTKA